MNKQQRITELTWENFWRQKRKEVFWFLVIAVLLVFLPYFVGDNLGDGMSGLCNPESSEEGYLMNEIEMECSTLATWAEGFVWILLVGFGLFAIGALMRVWVRSNWWKAGHRAEEQFELENTERRKKK